MTKAEFLKQQTKDAIEIFEVYTSSKSYKTVINARRG